MEETLYLLSSPNNRKHLLESIKELNDGKGIKFKLEDLWK
jgi:PHD/YefM family antitoxin component YafN of YafNO toxin-antitoxin module